MHSDFLHKHAQTPLHENYIAAGVACSLHTNSQPLIESARESFLPLDQGESVEFSLCFWIDGSDEDRGVWSKPYVRGLNDLVFAGFGVRSSLLADLRTRRVIGRFSATMADDCQHWRSVVFPILLSVIAGTAGILELHASCVARDDEGLVLMGPSCSGKSTLAMAMAQDGFRVLSDDRTFCALKHGRLLAYGLPRPLKLRPEAAPWFSEFQDRVPTEFQNGEPVFYWEPSRQLGQPRFVCNPRAVIVLDRQQTEGFEMSRMESREVMLRIESELLAEVPAAIQEQQRVLDSVAALPIWKLCFGGQPRSIAQEIANRVATMDSELTA